MAGRLSIQRKKHKTINQSINQTAHLAALAYDLDIS